MAISSWPFDGQTVSESQYSMLFNMLQRSGVQGAGDFAIAPSAGLVLSVASGLALVRGHAVLLDAPTTVTLSPADVTARVDRVVLRLDPTANAITIEKKNGTAGSPAPPALTQTTSAVYEYLLADVAVAGGATVINVGDITSQRTVLHAPVKVGDIDDASAIGKTILSAADPDAVLTALGATAVGKALIAAATAAAAREAMRFFKNGAAFAPAADDLKYTDL